MPLFRMEEDKFIYFDEMMERFPKEVQDKVDEWDAAIKLREKYQVDPCYIIFEGVLEKVYDNDQYIEARQVEMSLFSDIIDFSGKYDMTDLIEHLICR